MLGECADPLGTRFYGAAKQKPSSSVLDHNSKADRRLYHEVTLQATINAKRPTQTTSATLQPIAGARKDASHRARFVLVYDALHTDIGSQRQIHDADENEKHIETNAENVRNAPSGLANLQIGIAHAEVCHSPKDETEPAVEKRRHDRKYW
jgi:hypothetical protein